MAVTYGAIGTTGSTTATTSVTAAYPTGISASTSKLYLVVTGRSNTANTSAAITGGGWTQVGAFEGGTGTWGVDTGTRRVEIWKKDTVTGSETGNVTITLAGTTANTLYARIVRVEVPAGYLTTEQFVSGADTTAGTGFSAAASSNATFTTDDLVLIAHAGTTDTSTLSSVSLTASGITFGTLSSRATVAATGGNDHRHVVYTAPVSTGSGSAVAPTFAYTGSASTSGPVGFLVITEVAPPVFTVQPTNQTVTEPATATFTTTVTGASSFQWQFRGAGAVDPQVLSVSNIALTTAQNQTPAVTVPADANAFIVGSEYYTNTLQTITFSGSGWMTVQGSGGDWDFNYANNAYAFGKITATGAQTLSVSGTRTYDEGPTCQIIWLKVEDPDDWVLDHQVDPPDASPTTLSVTVNSETGGLVVGIFGNFSTPAVPSGTTQVGSSQTTNGHTTLVYSVDSVGATTTTVTSASYNFPTLFAVSVKAASSAWANVTDGTGGTTDDYTTAATSVAITGRQYRLRATGPGGTTDSDVVTLTVNASSGQTLTPSLYTNNQTFYAPTVGRGTVTLTPALFTNNQTFYNPTASATYGLTPALFTNGQAFYAPTVAAGTVTLSPALFTNNQTFYSPTVSGGAVTLTPDLFTNAQTFYGPTVSSTYTLAPELLTNGQTFYAPSVTVGAVTVSPSLFTNNQTFYQPTVTPGSVTLSPALFTNGQTFYSPEITQTLPGELYPPLLVNTNVFFEATLTGGGRGRRAGGSGPAVRKGYIIQGKRYYLNQNELAVMLAQMMKEVKRSSVQEIRDNKPANLSRKSWAELKQTLARLNDLTAPKVEESDDDDEDILMLL